MNNLEIFRWPICLKEEANQLKRRIKRRWYNKDDLVLKFQMGMISRLPDALFDNSRANWCHCQWPSLLIQLFNARNSGTCNNTSHFTLRMLNPPIFFLMFIFMCLWIFCSLATNITALAQSINLIILNSSSKLWITGLKSKREKIK